MRSVIALVLGLSVAVLILFLMGCAISGGFMSNPGSATGTVSSVHLSVIGGDVQVTFVALRSNGFSNQLGFCCNHVAQFPMNTSVTVNFYPGQDCNQIIVIVTG